MITNTSANKAWELSAEIRRRGVDITPISGTILEELTHVAMKPSTFGRAMMAKEGPVYSEANDLVAETKAEQEGPSLHDETMAECRQLVMKALMADNDRTRNQVIPAINALIKEYEEELERRSVTVSDPIQLVKHAYHSVWGMPHTQGLVERYENTPMVKHRMHIRLPALNAEQLKKVIMTGVDTHDEALANWFEDFGAEKFVTTYTKYFVEHRYEVGASAGADHKIVAGDFVIDRNDVLLIFLVAMSFEDHMVDMSLELDAPLDQLRNDLANTLRAAGRSVMNEILRRDRDLKMNNLVIARNKVYDEISSGDRILLTVNDDVFKRYTENGGSVDALFGMVLSDSGPVVMKKLLEEQELHEKAYQRKQAIYNQKLSAQVFTMQRDAMSFAFLTYLKAAPDAIKDRIGNSIKDIHLKGVEILGNVSGRMWNPELIAERIVCDTLFSNTNSKLMLDAMKVAAQENENITPREAATLANIDLYARWVCGQIHLTYGDKAYAA